ncbi:MAG: glycine betaine ABC transporter substrate-binding protein [Ascidiaceihabitans sp.]|uniref:glycine betaine ABC transporter substrate-binding protein n=1 Tax=Rhodobacterales TaxID=204455 RepID=UPI00329A7694
MFYLKASSIEVQKPRKLGTNCSSAPEREDTPTKMIKTLLVGGAILVSTPALAEDIVIGVPNWPSVNAAANILKVAIEQNLGLQVELQNGTNPIVFEAMDSGAMHIHPEVWLPNQQNLADKFSKENGTVVINKNGLSAFQGMCADHVTAEAHGITSIDDLTKPDVAALIDRDGDGQGELWIGAPGWASTNVEQIRAKSYGYDQTMELNQTDETIAYAELDTAIKAGEPWIGFCYGPHYIFALIRRWQPSKKKVSESLKCWNALVASLAYNPPVSKSPAARFFVSWDCQGRESRRWYATSIG